MIIDDNDIYLRMKEDPESGFRLLVAKFQEPVYWHIRRTVVSHEDARDATQDTFVKVFQSFLQLKEGAALRAWIYRIASREALSLIERNARPGGIIQRLDSKAEAPADQYIDYTDLETIRLQRAIQTLPPKQRITFNLRYYDEMSYDEIAQATETTPLAAKVSYHLAKEKVIKYIKTND